MRRLGSYVKSYNEMTKGEEFVIREVRSRAREARRLPIAAVFLIFAAALLVPPFFRRRRAGGAA